MYNWIKYELLSPVSRQIHSGDLMYKFYVPCSIVPVFNVCYVEYACVNAHLKTILCCLIDKHFYRMILLTSLISKAGSVKHCAKASPREVMENWILQVLERTLVCIFLAAKEPDTHMKYLNSMQTRLLTTVIGTLKQFIITTSSGHAPGWNF